MPSRSEVASAEIRLSKPQWILLFIDTIVVVLTVAARATWGTNMFAVAMGAPFLILALAVMLMRRVGLMRVLQVWIVVLAIPSLLLLLCGNGIAARLLVLLLFPVWFLGSVVLYVQYLLIGLILLPNFILAHKLSGWRNEVALLAAVGDRAGSPDPVRTFPWSPDPEPKLPSKNNPFTVTHTWRIANTPARFRIYYEPMHSHSLLRHQLRTCLLSLFREHRSRWTFGVTGLQNQ